MRRHVALHPKLIQSEQVTSEAAIKPFKNEIFEYLQSLEGACSTLNPVMIDNQPEITWLMRPYIIDFLVELHLFFKLSQETLFLACFIADKYCSKRIVYKRHYQLLIATSLWIAAKFQDKKTRIPTLKELSLLCHQIYDSKMFLQMEKHILTTLEWSIGSMVSTFDMFQLLLSTSSEATIPKTPELLGLASFLCDLTLYERNYMCYSSSTKAITSFVLASRILSLDSFPNYLNQLIPHISDTTDSCFHIAGDNNTDDISLSLCKQTLDEVRNCLYLFLRDIFKEKTNNRKETISFALVKKYKNLPIRTWLDNYKSENYELYAHLCSLNDSLKQSKNNPYSSTIYSYLKDSIFSYIDQFAGFTNYHNNAIDFDPSDVNISHVKSPFTPFSSNSTIDLNIPNQLEVASSISSRTSIALPASLNLSHLSGTNSRNVTVTPNTLQFPTSQFNACPPTPSSAHSTFSKRPSLSTSTSSFSSSSTSTISPAVFMKKSFRSSSRHSPTNTQRVISRQFSAQSEIYE